MEKKEVKAALPLLPLRSKPQQSDPRGCIPETTPEAGKRSVRGQVGVCGSSCAIEQGHVQTPPREGELNPSCRVDSGTGQGCDCG